MGRTSTAEVTVRLSLMEASELVRQLEERLGVSAVAAVHAGWKAGTQRNLAISQVNGIMSALLSKLLASILLIAEQSSKMKVNVMFQPSAYDPDSDPVMLAILPVFREIARTGRLSKFSEQTETSMELDQIADRARAALEKREHPTL